MGSVGVVGAGIIGLSSAVCILERDPTVKLTVIADKFTPNTTSDGAAGLILPIHMGNTPVHLQRKWFKATMEELERLSQRDDAGSYLTIYKTTTFDVTDESCEDPFWADLVDGYRHLSQKELAQISKTAKFGYSFTTWFFNGRNYLPWLIERLKSLGGTISKKTINSLDELAGSYDVVVNCSGMGARKLVNDSLVHPIRGQVLRVYAPWIKQAYCLNTKEWHSIGRSCYILPQANGEVVLGGTAYHNNFDTRVNADDTRHILESTSQLVPSLKQARMINAWVGLRPGRTSARLEKEEKRFRDNSGKEACLKIVHNYGHGGSGLTMHWGCALDTADLVFEFLAAHEELNSKL